MSDPSPDAYLEFEIDGQQRRYSLLSVCRIGRSDSNDIVLVDDLVSRSHTILHCDGGVYRINDVGSSNGTFVNGGRVTAPCTLRHGDCIKIGNHELRFQHQTGAAPKTQEPPREFDRTNILIAQKLITVLVADIRDFTGLAQRLDAAVLSQITSAFFRDGGIELQQRGAWAQKYIGDAVMAVWLHTGNQEQDILEVLAALAKLQLIAGGLQERLGLSESIRIGAGINTGMAQVGNVGSVAAADHTALGDTVNRAFRLETSTKEIGFEIAVGQNSHELLRSHATLAAIFQPLSVNLKGYSQPVNAWATNFELLLSVFSDQDVPEPRRTFKR